MKNAQENPLTSELEAAVARTMAAPKGELEAAVARTMAVSKQAQATPGPFRVRGLGLYEGDDRIADFDNAGNGVRIASILASAPLLAQQVAQLREALNGLLLQLTICGYHDDKIFGSLSVPVDKARAALAATEGK